MTGWAKDPLIHALFVAPDEIRSLLQDCAELKSFFQMGGFKTAVALLTATKRERTIFGTAQQGEIIRRDVPQTAVEFYDHRIAAPVVTEEENRRQLVNRGLNVLATHALEEIIQLQSIREDLTSQQRILALKVKVQQGRDRGLEGLMSGGYRKDPDAEKARQVLAEIDKQLTELEPGSGTSEDFLRKLEKVLVAADNVFTGKRLAMRLNWMGVKSNEESTSEGSGIALTELEIPDRLKRVALLVNISVDETLKSALKQHNPELNQTAITGAFST